MKLSNKQKERVKKIVSIFLISIAVLFVAAILIIVVSFEWDRHEQKRKYEEALMKCGGTTYQISSSPNLDGRGEDWVIVKSNGKFNYLPFSSVFGYACSIQDAKKVLLSNFPGVPEQDLNLRINN
jgi:hypothetical protein